MAGSGSAWIKPRKRTGLRPEALKQVPHPRFLRPGQRYFRLQGRPVTLRIMGVPAGVDWCEARYEDGDQRAVRLKQARLLAVTLDGAGRHYRFVGYAPRTYDTHVCVAAVRDAWLDVVCPEWHPSRTIALAVNSVPERFRHAGAWLACRAELAAGKPALVQPRRLAEPSPGFVAGERYRIDLADHRPVVLPSCAPGGGDVIIYTGEEIAVRARHGKRTLHVVGHPPPVRAGGRVYLHYGGRVQAWSAVEHVRPTPSGMLLRFACEWHDARDVDAPPGPPGSGVASGAHGTQMWRWRT